MDFLENILNERSGELLGALRSQAGFSDQEAERFLPEVGSALGPAMTAQASKLDLTELASTANIGALLGSLDVVGLARKVGLSAEQTTDGINAVVPRILGFLTEGGQDAGGLLSLLGKADDATSALGSIRKLGGLFK